MKSNTEICSEVYFNSTNEDYFEKRMNASIIRDKNEQKIKEIIIMVKKIFERNIDKAREETDVVLEETNNDELEELVNVADSILEQQIHPHNCNCQSCDESYFINQYKQNDKSINDKNQFTGMDLRTRPGKEPDRSV